MPDPGSGLRGEGVELKVRNGSAFATGVEHLWSFDSPA